MSDVIDKEMENRKGSAIDVGCHPAGFLGKDQMRERAEKELGADIKRSNKSYPVRQSDSAKDTEHFRPY